MVTSVPLSAPLRCDCRGTDLVCPPFSRLNDTGWYKRGIMVDRAEEQLSIAAQAVFLNLQGDFFLNSSLKLGFKE